MNFGIHIVRDDELPAGIKRVVVERRGDVPLVLLAESHPAIDFVMRYRTGFVDDGDREPVRLRAV